MKRLLLFACIIVTISLPCVSADADPNEDLIQLIENLIGEQDQDLRALGFEQVRTEAKGEVATRRFAQQLPKLSPDAQVGLLRALADRGDAAARSQVVDLLKATKENRVRVAAISALGNLGNQDDLGRLIQFLATGVDAERDAARTSLVRMRGESVASALAGQMTDSPPSVRVSLIEILAARRARDTIPALMAAATGDDPKVRSAAMNALAQIADSDDIAGMVQGVLKAELGTERDAAEKAIMAVANRTGDAERRADALLAAIEKLRPADQTALLPALGRIGGSKALEVVAAAVSDRDLPRHEAGVRALCNWPNASIAPRLIELAETDAHDDHRHRALSALIRVAPLPDGRPDAKRLTLTQQVLGMCQTDRERNTVLKRASAIRAVETLRFLLPFLDQPAFAQQAAESIVELAHHRGLREPNEAEFHRALDRVIATSKDAVVIDRANRYKRDQTWVRPKS